MTVDLKFPESMTLEIKVEEETKHKQNAALKSNWNELLVVMTKAARSSVNNFYMPPSPKAVSCLLLMNYRQEAAIFELKQVR